MTFFANNDAFLLLLLLIPLAVVKLAGDAMARRRVLRIAGARLLPRLQRGGWPGRELLTFGFEALALAFFVAALARPQWGFTEREVQGEGRSIIIALDTSRSMLATDLKPNRLTRAKLAAQDLVAALPGDKIGLIAFAGRSFLQAPLTTDHEALIEALQQFDTELIPRGGTNLSEPIDLAAEVFDKAGTASHALIMFSDGDELEGNAIEVARKAREKNIMIVTVGVGTREGALLPDDNPRNRTGFMKDSSGRPVRSKLEDRVLEGLARETGGLYLNLSSTSVLKERVEVILNKLDRSRTAAQKDKRQPIERYQWALIPGMICLFIAFALRLGRRLRRVSSSVAMQPVAAAFALLAMVSVPADGGVVVPTDDSPGPSPWQLFDAGDFAASAEKFDTALAQKPRREKAARLEFGRGASLFREKEHDAAIEAFGNALTSTDRPMQAEAAYNIGNTLADKAKALPKGKGRVSSMIALITEAISHYDEALAIEPSHENARINRDLLKKYLEQLKEYREQLRQKSRDKKKQKQQGDQGEKQEGQQGQQGQQNPDGSQGDQGKPGQGQSGEEEDEESDEGDQGDTGGDNENAEGSQGDQPKGAKGEGKEEGDGKGNGPNDREQAGPEGNEKERSGEQKEGGKVEAKGGGEDGKGEKSEQPGGTNGKRGDEKRDQKTGFSRSEARALLRALSDEDYVRPLTDRALPEGTYKNW